MKAKIRIIIVLCVMLTSCITYPGSISGQQSAVSFQVFYDQLSPYGQWVDDSNYGYVWIPNSDADFAPYSSNGHWVSTNYGWTWASDYSWGWATFHYGRWSFNNSFGWFWVPDNEWGPAWVNWREADGYYGWEPMQPGMSLSMSFNGGYDSNNDHWLFVSNRDFERTDINHYYVNRGDRDRIVRNSIIINNTYVDNTRRVTYVTGPSRTDVQRSTGRTIVPLTISENNRPGQQINNGQMQIYRPQIQKRNESVKTAPTVITNQRDVKKSQGRDASIQQNDGTNNPTIRNQQNNTRQPETSPAQNNRPVQQQPNTTNPRREVTMPVQEQNRTTPPANEQPIRTVEPSRPTPADNSRPERQPNVPPQQNTNPQPVQQRNVMPQNNQPQSVPDRNTNQPNNNQQRNTQPASVETKTQPVQRQNVKQVNNRRAPAQKQETIKQEVQKQQAKEPDKVTEPSVPERR